MSHFMQMSAHVKIEKEEPKWEADGAKPRKNGILVGRRVDAILHIGHSGRQLAPARTRCGTSCSPGWFVKGADW